MNQADWSWPDAPPPQNAYSQPAQQQYHNFHAPVTESYYPQQHYGGYYAAAQNYHPNYALPQQGATAMPVQQAYYQQQNPHGGENFTAPPPQQTYQHNHTMPRGTYTQASLANVEVVDLTEDPPASKKSSQQSGQTRAQGYQAAKKEDASLSMPEVPGTVPAKSTKSNGKSKAATQGLKKTATSNYQATEPARKKSTTSKDNDTPTVSSKGKRKAAPKPDPSEPPQKAKKSKPSPSDSSGPSNPPPEKRLKRFRPKAPLSFTDIRDRALTQRMFVINRTRSTSSLSPHDLLPFPTETMSLVGTTGNVYTVKIEQIPTCDCPHAKKGNQCKHVVYALCRVLRAPEHLTYQLALVPSELRTIFAGAPDLPGEKGKENGGAEDGKRKGVEGECCPICFEDFDAKEKERNVVWCRAGCGNNIHRECFEQWAATARGQRKVTCPFCRVEWEGDEAGVRDGRALEKVREGRTNGEGYVNVAGEFGLSGRRDYSTYNEFWVRRQQREGYVDEYEWEM